jgi:transcriptional regulator
MRKITQKDKAKIIMQLEKGITSTKIASKLGFTRQQVAAVKAHMTMGTY